MGGKHRRGGLGQAWAESVCMGALGRHGWKLRAERGKSLHEVMGEWRAVGGGVLHVCSQGCWGFLQGHMCLAALCLFGGGVGEGGCVYMRVCVHVCMCVYVCKCAYVCMYMFGRGLNAV